LLICESARRTYEPSSARHSLPPFRHKSPLTLPLDHSQPEDGPRTLASSTSPVVRKAELPQTTVKPSENNKQDKTDIMSDDRDLHSPVSSGSPSSPAPPHEIQRSGSAVSSSPSDSNDSVIHQPVPMRPRLPSRKSSGPLVVPRDSSEVGPVDAHFGPDDVRAMSPRRTSEDIDKMGKAAREEMRRYV
jgi:hypothetical protein